MITQTVTAHDLIKLALKTAGVLAVGQSALAEDMNDALLILNSMMASWNQNRWLIYDLQDVSTRSTGAQFYTVGVGGDFDTNRPDRLEAAYARLPTGVDYSLGMLDTYEQYSELALKSLHSFPATAFYDAALGLGKLYVWPIPSDDFELHIIVKNHMTQFSALTALITLPPEYFDALYYNLAGRLALAYQLPVNPGVAALAAASLNQIGIANHRVANLKMPLGMSRNGGWANHGVGGLTQGTFTFEEDTIG